MSHEFGCIFENKAAFLGISVATLHSMPENRRLISKKTPQVCDIFKVN